MSSRYFSSAIALLTLASIGGLSPAAAQLPLEADGTLGGEASIVIPNGGGNFEIDGGATRGGNLFHSFEEFNVNEGGSVYFRNPAAIDNILSRVTGDNASNILGTLGVLGEANLFLLNPNGIVFGRDARLDVSGSFYASTGDRFSWADGSEFRATNPNAPPLLSINVPLGLQYGAPSGNITHRGILFAEEGLNLHANSLNLRGQLWSGGPLTLFAEDTLQIRDNVNYPFIAASQGRMVLQGNETIDIFALNHPDSGFWSGGNMVLRSTNAVGGDAQYFSGGNFRVEQLDNTLGTLFSPYDPVIRSLGDVRFDVYQGNSLHILAAGDVVVPNYVQILGAADPLTEEALVEQTLRLSNGDPFPIDGFLEPTLDIRAGVDPDVIGTNQLPATGNFFGTLNLTPPPVDSANIEVGTILMGFVASDALPPEFLQGRILLTNQYAPDVENPLPGNIRLFDTQVDLPNNTDLNGVAIRAESQRGGGLVAIDSRGTIRLEGRINANAVPTGTTPDGLPIFTTDGGDVTLLANGSIQIRPNPETAIANNINSSGRLGGAITLLSRNGNILLEGPGTQLETLFIPAGLASESLGQAPTGIGGNIELTALRGNILIQNGASVSSQVAGTSQQGGTLTLNAPAGNIRLQNNAGLLSSIFGQADAGSIVLATGADGRITVSGESQVRGLVEQGGSGRSADITLQTGRLLVEDSQISGGLFREVTQDVIDPATGRVIIPAGPGGQGAAGTINVTAADSVVLRGTTSEGFSSGLLSASGRGAVGPAGDIRVEAGDRILITDGGVISSLSANASPSGNVTLLTDTFRILRGGRIVSTSREAGAAGTVTVSANDRIVISGVDPNYADRLTRINDYLQNDPFGSTNDTLEDVLGVREEELNNRDAGGIFVNASEEATSGNLILIGGAVEISDRAEVLSTSGNADTTGFSTLSVTATEGSLVISDLSRISSSNFGTGLAGDVVLNATDRIRINEGAGIFSQGQLGRILIGVNVDGTAVPPERVLIGDRATIQTTNTNPTRAGDIIITASDAVVITGREIPFTTTTPTQILSTGNFGRVVIGQPIELETDPSPTSRLIPVSPQRILLNNARISTNNDPLPDEDGVVFGPAGNISLQARETLQASGSDISSVTVGEDSAGRINLVAGDIELTAATEINTATSGTGEAGDIGLLARRNVLLEDARVFSNVNENAGTTTDPAAGGTITLDGRQLFMSQGAQIQVQVNPNAVGNGGNVFIRSDRLIMRGESDNTGTAIFSNIQEGAIGQGGTIFVGEPILNAEGQVTRVSPINRVDLRRGAQLQAQTEGIGGSNAGSVFVVARDIALDGFAQTTIDGGLTTFPSATFSQVGEGAEGNGGFVFLGGGLRFDEAGSVLSLRPSDTISITNGASIFAETRGTGNAGQVSLVGDRLTLSGNRDGFSSAIFTLVGENADGAGGNVLLSSRIRVNPRDNSIVVNPATDIAILDGAQVRSETAGRTNNSNAGNVRIVGETIRFEGTENLEPSGIITRVESGSPGTGGTIFLSGRTRIFPDGRNTFQAADSIALMGGAQLQSQTAGQGNAGNVYLFGEAIEVDGFVDGVPSAIFSGVDQGTGQGGTIFISGTGRITNPITTTAQQRSDTGTDPTTLNLQNTVTFNEDDSITVGNQFLSRSPVHNFRIGDGAIVSVSSFGLGSIGQVGAIDPNSIAGNIFIHARTLDMDNNRTNLGLENERGIFAETGAGNSGNIDLAIEDLLLLRGSTRISTTAGTLQQPGNGGFITITTDDEGFVIAEPFGNNDITSNAFFGAGGEVEITAEQILGLFFRSSEDLRELLDTDDPAELDTERLSSSDVTALSQSDSSLDGRVIFNVIGVDPAQGLVSLPTDIVDAADQIGQVCPTGPGAAEQLGRFVVTGRGGISPSPLDVLDDPDIAVDWLEDGMPAIEADEATPQSQNPSPSLVEADGWTRDEDGRVQLVATQGVPEAEIGDGWSSCP